MSIDAFFFSAGGAERAQRIHRRGAGAPRRSACRRGDARPGRGSAGGRLLRLCILSGRAPSGASSGLYPNADPGSACSAFSGNPVYLSSDLSCSTLRARLTAAQEAFGGRLWLIVRPLSRFFTLPCPSGEGLRVSPEAEDRLTQLDAPVFSRALCCMYCRAAYCGRDGLYLFDTQESIAEKLRLAEDCGAAHVLLLPPETDVL